MEALLTCGLSSILGITMKFADLCDEHRFRFFWGDRFVFGILWGVSAIALMRVDGVLTGLWIAITISFIARAKIDFLNHGIAASAIILDLIYRMSVTQDLLNPIMVSTMAAAYFVIGQVHDTLSDRIIRSELQNSERDLSKQILHHELLHTVIAYGLIPFVISVVISNWLLLESALCFGISYEFSRRFGPLLANRRKGPSCGR